MFSFYTAYGMSTLPVLLIKGQKTLQDTKNELELRIEQTRKNIKEFDIKEGKNNGLSKKEKKEKNQLEKKEKKLTNKLNKIHDKGKEKKIFEFFQVLAPFRVMVGVITLIISVLFVLSLLLGSINRLISSECGFSCGFIETKSTIFNPLDSLLVSISCYFPLDYFVFSSIILYIFVSSLYGIVA